MKRKTITSCLLLSLFFALVYTSFLSGNFWEEKVKIPTKSISLDDEILKIFY